MGNQQTTRRVQFEREQTGLIAISDSVAKRLREAEQHGKNSDQKEQAHHVDSTPTRTEKTELLKENVAPSRTKKPVDSSSTTRSPSPFMSPYTSSNFLPQSPLNSTFTSETQSQNGKPDQDTSRDTARLEEVWQDKYKRLESDNDRIKRTSTEEFNRAVKDVETMLESTRYSPPGKSELQKAVMDCYKENTSRSLNCAREAEAFIKNIDDRKMGFLSRHVF